MLKFGIVDMKWLIWIWLAMAGIFPSATRGLAVSSCTEAVFAVVPAAQSQQADYEVVSFRAMPAASYSGEETSNLAAPVRTLSQSRQGGHSLRSNCKVVRTGKVVDRCVSRSFRIAYSTSPSGLLSPDKYLHSIRILLI